MAKKQAGENSKKALGNAKKAEVAAQKAAAENAKNAALEEQDWSVGAKSDTKAKAAEKQAEALRKKQEREALLKAEEDEAPSGPKKNAKQPVKKSKGLDLSQLDDSPTSPSTPKSASALNASGIDNALDALAITSGSNDKIDRHPERRFKAAYAAFEERRMGEMAADGSGQGLRMQQRKANIRKEFERHPDNPFNQVNAAFDATREEVKDLRTEKNADIEARLASSTSPTEE